MDLDGGQGLTDDTLSKITFPFDRIKKAKHISSIIFTDFLNLTNNTKITKLPKIIIDIINEIPKIQYYINSDNIVTSKFDFSYDGLLKIATLSIPEIIKTGYLLNTFNFGAISNRNNEILDVSNEQVSALVKQYNYFYTSGGVIDDTKDPIISTYILPRHEFDDLIYKNIFFKVSTEVGAIAEMIRYFADTAYNYLTTIYSNQYEIISENIKNNTLFDYKKHIETINYYDVYGPKYITNTYDDEEKTFIMKYPHHDTYHDVFVKYKFYNSIPIAYIKYRKNRINPDLDTLESIIQKGYEWKEITENTHSYENSSSYWSYGYTGSIYLSSEERLKHVINRHISVLSRWLNAFPFQLVPKKDKITTSIINIENKQIEANNYLQLLFEFGTPNSYQDVKNKLDTLTECNIYYNTTLPINESTNLSNIKLSVANPIVLTNYKYNLDINPPISEYLSSVILTETGYTRRLSIFIRYY